MRVLSQAQNRLQDTECTKILTQKANKFVISNERLVGFMADFSAGLQKSKQVYDFINFRDHAPGNERFWLKPFGHIAPIRFRALCTDCCIFATSF